MQHQNRPPRDGGQAAIEFALTSMVTLLLIFALIDFSRAIYAASVVQWAATYGARFGVNDPDDLSGIEDEVKSRLAGLEVDKATVAVTEPATNVIQVEVSYDFEFIAPIVTGVVGEGLTLTGSASMVAH